MIGVFAGPDVCEQMHVPLLLSELALYSGASPYHKP